MSRPVIFNQPFVYNWSTEANFPSGAYAGTPTKVTPTGDIFFPDQPLAAQPLNYVLSQFGPVDMANQNWNIANLTGILNWTGNDIALQWYPTQLAATMDTGLFAGDTNNHGLQAVCWNPFDQVWQGLFSVIDSGGPTPRMRVAINSGTDTTWTADVHCNQDASAFALTAGTSDMIHDPYFEHVTYWAVSLGPGNGFEVFMSNNNTGTTSILTVGGFTVQNITLSFFGLSGYLIVGVTDAAGTNTALYSSDDLGVTWGHTTYATQTGKWYFQPVDFAGTAYIAAIASGLGGQTALLHLSTTGAPGSWSVGSSVGGAGENVHGLARFNQPISSTAFAQYLATSVGHTVQVTGNGASWTTQHTSVNADCLDDIRGAGTILVASLDITKLTYNFSRGGVDDMALVFSLDSGVTWSWSPNVLRPATAAVRRLVDNSTLDATGTVIVPATQLGMYHTGALRLSMAQGASMAAGF
jgi:hypothetical protein